MASASLYRQCDATASSGYSTTWTWSGWVKRSSIGSSEQGIFMNKKDSDNTASRFRMSFGSSDKLLWECKDSTNSDDNSFQTNMLFRDPSAWYHIVFSYDSSQGTEANRLKLWVNGVDIRNDGGGFSSINEASSNFGTLWSSASKHYVGRTGNNSGTAHYFDGYMTHVHLTYGTTYTASTFGQTDATTGIWKPKTSPSVTYGSQGYFLKMDNSANMGLDSSGQSNNLTTSGTIIQQKDTPSNVHCTMNPLQNKPSSNTYSQVNNTVSYTVNNDKATASIGFNSGKWYWEQKYVNASGGNAMIGIGTINSYRGGYLGQDTTGWSYYAVQGNTYHNGSSSSYGDSFTTNDIIGTAFNADTRTIWFSKNGVWQNSATISEIAAGTTTNSAYTDLGTAGEYFFPVTSGYNGNVISWNFGNGFFGTTAITSAGSNGNGSLFEYDVPTGYYALNTKNLGTQS